MSFINWGSETPEQLAIRRRAEESALYEQAVRMAQARNRAGNSPGAVGGGSVAGENLPAYCADNTTRVTYTLWTFDTLNPKFKKYRPTAEDFDNYFDPGGGDYATDNRAWRNSFYQADILNMESEFFYKRPATAAYPDPPHLPHPELLFWKLPPTRSKITWFCNNVNSIEEWVDRGSNIEMPGVTKLRTLTAVADEAAIPATGSPGDIVWNLETGTWYAWDKNLNTWTEAYYNDWIEPYHTHKKNDALTSHNKKKEMSLAILPFLMAAKYIPEFRIKKDNL